MSVSPPSTIGKVKMMLDDLLRGCLWILKALLLVAVMMMPYLLNAVAEAFFGLPQDYKL